MALSEKLQKIAEASAKQIPEEAQKIMHTATAEVAASIAGRKIPQVGDSLPEFAMPDSTGTLVSSAEVAKTDPFVLSFFRGKW